jgi:histidinol-phosphate aminotransferase
MNKYIRKDLENFRPYHAPLKPYEIKVDANENPFPHHEALKEAIGQWTKEKDNFTRYPDTDAHALRAKISEHYNVSKDNVMCGVGSDQVIECIIKVFIEPLDKVVMPTPTFSMYKLSTIVNHGQVIEVPLDDEFEYDLDLFIRTIKEEQPKLVFLCTPNNPTGCILNKEQIVEVIKACNCPIVVDEAYAEFTGISVVDMIDEYDNLIVVRTFSKSYGLAGLRTGYAIANKEMIDTLNVTKPPYNLSSFSQMASLFVLKHHSFYMEQVELLKKQRAYLAEQLKTLNFVEKVYNSGTNFLLIRVSDYTIVNLLEANKILVRDYPPTGDLANCIRITIGTEKENQKLLQILYKFGSTSNGK